MLTIMRGLAALLACVLVPLAAAQSGPDRVQVHPFPNAIRYNHHNDDFTVRVRVPGGVWQDLYEYRVAVDLDSRQDASMVYFNFDGTVELAVQKNNGSFAKVAVRPDSKGIRPKVEDGVVYFTLHKPENLSVEFDDDHLHNLHVFTHAIRHDMPAVPEGLTPYDIGAAQTPDLTQKTVFFGPGIYSGNLRLQSHTTVYIDGSALLKSPLILDGVEDVKVISDGLFDGTDVALIRNSHNIDIDGPISFNQPRGTMRCETSQDVVERNIRTIGGGQWSDGLGHFACERVKIADSFIRTSDDCITLYNHRWNIWGDTRDISVTNTTLWADVAHAVMIGLHGNTPTPAHPQPEVLEHLRFTNIDILDHDEDEPAYEGAIGIMAGDDNLVRDVLFDDIRVERIEEGKLFSLAVVDMGKYNTSPGRGIENVTLRNIRYSGKGSPSAARIAGYDAKHKVSNVLIDNVSIAGKPLRGPLPNVLDINQYVENVRFSGGPK
jgi:hypothetical protein